MKKFIKFLSVAALCCVALVTFVSCNKYTGATIEEAKTYLWNNYKNDSKDVKKVTAKDYVLDAIVKIDDVSFGVTWSLKENNLTNVQITTTEGVQTLDIIDDMATTAEDYTLVATIEWPGATPNGQKASLSLEFERTYPAFVENTWAEYKAACEASSTATITIKANIIGMIATGSSKYSFYAQDADGYGYYCYNPAFTADEKAAIDAGTEFTVGTEVFVTGTCTQYNGQLEFNKNCSVRKTGGPAAIRTATNATADFAAASSSSDYEKLAKYQNALVTLDNCIMTNIVAGSKAAYNFVCGKEYAITDVDYFLTDSTLIAAWQAKFVAGQSCKVTGIVSVYSNKAQIYPVSVDVITDVQAPTLSDAELLELARNVLTIDTDIYSDSDKVLPITSPVSDKISIAWTLKEEYENATIAEVKEGDPEVLTGYKVTYTLNKLKEVKVIVKAALTIGETTVNRAYEVTLTPPTILTVSEFLAIDYDKTDTTVYAVKGWVVASGAAVDSTGTEAAGSFEVADATGAVFSYNKFLVHVGDFVVLYGTRSENAGIAQIGTSAVDVCKAEDASFPNPYNKANAEVVDATAKPIAEVNSTYAAGLSGKLLKFTGMDVATDGSYYNGMISGSRWGSFYVGDNCEVAKYIGLPVNVYGYVRGYSEGKYLTIQVAEFEVNLPEATDAEKVAFEKEKILIETKYTEPATDVELPVAGRGYTDVVVSWALKDTSEIVTLAGNKMTVTMPGATTEVVLVATLTAGTVTDTKEVTITVAVSNSSIAKALEICKTLTAATPDEYYLIGNVSEITSAYSEQYGNVSYKLSDGVNEIIIYRSKQANAATLAVGDIVAVRAKLTNYNGTLETNGTVTVADVMSIGDAVTAGVGSTGVAGTKVYGKISKIGTAYDSANNRVTVTITDGLNSIDCYRMTGGEDLQVGDYILVTGTPSAYKGAAQMAAGATYTMDYKYVAPVTSVTLTEDTTVSFAPANQKSKVTSYTDSFETTDGMVTLKNYNNNSGGWDCVKCGRSGAASVAEIVTKNKISNKIAKVVLTVSALSNADKINSVKLVMSATADFANPTEVSITLATGDNEFVITTPVENMYYKVVIDMQATGKNGNIATTGLKFVLATE